MHIIHVLIQIFQTEIIPFIKLLIIYNNNNISVTKRAAMTSELIMAKQVNM